MPQEFLRKFMKNKTIRVETEKILREVLASRRSLKVDKSVFKEENEEDVVEPKKESLGSSEFVTKVKYETRLSENGEQREGLSFLMSIKSVSELNDNPNILKSGIFSKRAYSISAVSNSPLKAKKSAMRKLSQDNVNEGASSGSPPTSMWSTVQKWLNKLLSTIVEKSQQVWSLFYEASIKPLLIQFGMLIAGLTVLHSANLLNTSLDKLVGAFFNTLLAHIN